MLVLIETIAAISTSLAPWFPPHLQRNIYFSLLHLEAEPGQEKAPTVPESVLKAALLRRATEDIHRIMKIRNAKQALSVLQQRGSIGDDLWQRFVRAEGEMEDELRDVVMEVSPTILCTSPIIISSFSFAFYRPMPIHPTGAKPSSKAPTRWPPTPHLGNALRRSNPRRRRKKNGGKNVERRSGRASCPSSIKKEPVET